MTNSINLKRALIIRALSGAGETPRVGAALAVLRADAMLGVHDDHPAGDAAKAVADRLLAMTPADMPPNTDDISTLLETTSQKLGGLGFAQVWASIGVNPNRGRDLMARNSGAVDWPIFFVLRMAALGK